MRHDGGVQTSLPVLLIWILNEESAGFQTCPTYHRVAVGRLSVAATDL
jgi:hypothetical protein